MLRTMLTSKIHRATVTQADLHYVGSVTVDEDLMDAADLLAGEQVAIVDVTNGARLETYVIAGPRGSGVIGINGAAARLVHVGDLVILIAYGQMDDAEARTRRPHVVFVDADNRVTGTGDDPAEALPGTDTVRGDTVHVDTGHVDTGHVDTGRVDTGHGDMGHVDAGRGGAGRGDTGRDRLVSARLGG